MDSSESEYWKKYFDDENKAYYWYNESSGESKWDDDCYTHDETGLIGNDADVESSVLNHSSTDSHLKTSTKIRKTVQTFVNGGALFICRCISKLMNCYNIFFYLNSMIIEAPLCVVESFVRCLITFIIILTRLIYKLIWFKKPFRLSDDDVCFVIDFLYTFFSSISFIVPGLICIIYRDYDIDTDWNLKALPTLIGNVDVRRFFVISFGNGSLAENVEVNENIMDTLWCNYFNYNNASMTANNMILVPRNIIRNLNQTITDVNRIDSRELSQIYDI